MKNLINFLKTHYIRSNEFQELKPSNNEKKEEKPIVEDTVCNKQIKSL